LKSNTGGGNLVGIFLASIRLLVCQLRTFLCYNPATLHFWKNHRASSFFLASILCLAASAIFAPTATADVLFSYGYSPQGIAMGGAYSALVDDYSAAYYNPAASVWIERPTAGIGYTVTGNTLWAKGAKAPDLDRTQGLIFGTVLPLGFGGFLRDRLAFGFSSFFPDGVVLAIQVPFPSEPQWVNLQNSGRSLTVIPTMGIRIIDGLSIGGGAQLFDNTSGQISAIVDLNARIEATVGQDLTTSASPTAGIHFAPGMIWPDLIGWRFGFVYREKFFTGYTIPVNTYVGSVPLTVTFDAVSLFTPRQLVLGAGWRNRRFSMEMDTCYNFWSEMPDPNLDVEVDFQVPIIPIAFSSSEGIEPDFNDTVTTRAGFGYRFLAIDDFDLEGRIGYFFDPTPVPTQSGRTNYLDSDRHVFSTGLGFDLRSIRQHELPGTFELDLALQYQHLRPRKFYKTTAVPDENPGYPSIEFGGGLWALSVTVATRFDVD
jgi:long-chain fatty acid transport protein